MHCSMVKVARFLVKTISRLGSGKMPVGTTEYMGRAEHLMQCRSNVRQGTSYFLAQTIVNFLSFFLVGLKLSRSPPCCIAV